MSLKDCKTLEKEAKALEKDELTKAIEKYQEAAACYTKNEKPKNGNNCLEIIGKLFRVNAKTIENPDEALKIYNKSSDFYNKAGNSAEAEKVLKEADIKFIESAKSLRIEAKKNEEPEAAEKIFSLASDNAVKGKDKELSNACWVDSGNQFKKKATQIENPREALEISKHAVTNYRKASNEELEAKTWLDAAEKFNKVGEETEKSKKNMVTAIDKYLQAKKLYGESKNIDKSKILDEKVKNLCELIGLPLDLITTHLETKNLKGIDLI